MEPPGQPEDSQPSDRDGAREARPAPSTMAWSSLAQLVPASGSVIFGSPLSRTSPVLWCHLATPLALQDKGEEPLAEPLSSALRCVIFP